MRAISNISKILLILTFLIFKPSYTSVLDLPTARDTYCQLPPFLQQDIYANVMLVIDVSGSMGQNVYEYYSDTEIYKGPFKYNAYYACYNVKKNEFTSSYTCSDDDEYWKIIEDDVPLPINYYAEINDTIAYSGNLLNNIYLERIDIIKWVLTGGSVTDVRGTPVVELNSGEKILLTDTTSYNPDTEQVEGILQKISRLNKKPRIGAYFFTGSGSWYYGIQPAIYDKVSPSYDYENLIVKINDSVPLNFTPTGPAMIDTLRYFSQEDGVYGGFDTGDRDYQDPYLFTINDTEMVLPCAKNYVVLLTDGLWNVPWREDIEIRDPVYASYNMWMGGYADLVNSLDGNQNAEVFSVALFLEEGDGLNSVKHVAIFGGFRDIDGNGWPCGYNDFPSPDSSTNVADISGLDCRNEWDKDGNGLPDNFASGNDPDTVKNAIESIFNKIISRLSSGTSVSVLSQKDTKGAVITQAAFYPQKQFDTNKVSWIGNIYTYWFLNTRDAQNIREDTNGNLKLDIKDDLILEFNINSTGELQISTCSSDDTGNSTGDCSTSYTSLDEIKYLWDAGTQLKNTEWDDRVIYVACDSCSSGVTLFDKVNKDKFLQYLGTEKSLFPDCLLTDDDEINYDKLIEYIKGKDFEGCRNRTVDSTGSTWKLGDIIYSTPVIVEYEDYSVVFSASNDGILHAFKLGKVEKLNETETVAQLSGTGLGTELWGFIPKNALPYLRFLADPDYCHVYINDLSPYIVTADYNNDGREEVILIGGMRLGGACGCDPNSTECNSLPDGECCVNPPGDVCNDTGCTGFSAYYALDISNPTSPKLLWEFTHERLGFSYSGPAFIKRKDNNGNWKYFVMFLSGPTHYKGYSNQDLYAFILDLSTGNLLREVNVASLNSAFGGRLFTNGLDVNEDRQTDYVFFGYVRTTDPNTADGGIVITYTGSADPRDWEFDNQYLNFARQPITAKIEFGKCFGKWYLFFGTGRFFFKDDNFIIGQNTTTDTGGDGGTDSSNSDTASLNALYGVPFNCDENFDCEQSSTINPVNIRDDQNIQCADVGTVSRGAWMIYLDGTLVDDNGNLIAYKERNIANPSFAENIVFFATTQPTANPCEFGGYSRAWALNCALGEPITTQTCPDYQINVETFKYLLQLSGGNIEEYDKESFSTNTGATAKTYGITSEQGGLPVFPFMGASSGEILLWIEK